MVLDTCKRIYKKQYRAFIILLSIVCGLIISQSTAFADDDMPNLSEEGYSLNDPLSGDEGEFEYNDDLFKELSQDPVYLHDLMLSSEKAAALPDTQNALNRIYWGLFGVDITNPIYSSTNNLLYVMKDTRDYTSLIYDEIDDYLVYLQDIATSADSIDSNLYLFYSRNHTDLTNIYSRQNTINTNITNFKNATHTDLTLIDTDLNAFATQNHTDETKIDTDLNAFATQNHTDETKIDTDLLAFKSANHTDITAFMTDFDNRYGYQISSIGSLVGVKKNYQDEEYVSTGTTTTGNLYYYYHFNNVSSLLNVIVVDIPVRSTSYPDNFDFSLLSPSLGVIPIQYEYIPFAQYVRLYIYDNNLRYRNGDLIIRVSPNNGQTLYYTTASASIGVLNNEFSWTLKNAMANVSSTEYLSHLNYMYSDDAERSKKAESQEVIDDTLDNFVGNGSAAAKKSDTSAMKDVSGSIKSGLNGGGSVSNALSVFNTSNSIWEWFSQSNYNNINNPSLQTRKSNDYVVDFYTDNQIDLHSMLGGK